MVEPNGKPKYVRICWFEGRERADAFSEAVLAGVDAYRGAGQ
jgi:hypothetical protein